MDDEIRIKILKLALAYHTGWEYKSGSKEAGSVIADVFWEMQKKNRERFCRIWDKHEIEFLQAVPPPPMIWPRQKTEIAVRASGARDGKKLPEGTCFYAVTEDGSLLEFETEKEITLNAARLQYVFYEKKGHAWLVYDRDRDGKDWEETGIFLFAQYGQEISRPSVAWKFQNIGNGLAACAWQITKEWMAGKELCAFSISDGLNAYPLELLEKEDAVWLEGGTPAFADNMEDTVYELRLEIMKPQWLPESMRPILEGKLLLEEPAYRAGPKLLITDTQVSTENEILPFGQQMDEFSCCYIGWKQALARPCAALTLQYEESFRLEEKLPEKKNAAYEKAVRKYPWLQQDETVHDWKAAETLWEYFDGEAWRALEGSAGWQTCCGTQEAQKTFAFVPPSGMAGCTVEGETLFYLRLRLLKTEHPYALYYRKYIPVLKNIRVERPACAWPGENLGGRACWKEDNEAEERMYFGFEQPLHPECGIRIVTETDSGEKAVAGYASIPTQWMSREGNKWGKEACWLKWDREQEEQAEDMAKLLSWNFNCVPVTEKEGGQDMGGSIKVKAGTEFSGGQDMESPLLAESLTDSCLAYSGDIWEDTRDWARTQLRSFGRIVTMEDIRRQCRERYPGLHIMDCRMDWSSQPVLTVVLQKEQQEESGNMEDEFAEWLEEILDQSGSIWLADCQVKTRLLTMNDAANT